MRVQGIAIVSLVTVTAPGIAGTIEVTSVDAEAETTAKKRTLTGNFH
jgi:hypothetical protein